MKTYLLVIYCLLFLILEILSSTFGNNFSFAAGVFWFIAAFIFIASSLVHITRGVMVDIKEKHYLSTLLLVFVFLLTFLPIFSYSFSGINHEATQQVSEGTKNLKKTNLNHSGTGFLGYPARQYNLMALPSLVFGNNIFSLRIVLAIFSFLSFALLNLSLKLFSSSRSEKNVSVLLSALLLNSPILLIYLSHYEQSIIPFTLTSCTLFWFIRFLKKEGELISGLNLVWLASFLGTSYSPGVSSFLLFLVFSLLSLTQNLKSSRHVLSWLAIIITSSTIVFLSFLSRTDFTKTSTGGYPINSDIIRTLSESAKAVLLPNSKSLFGPILIICYLIYLIDSFSLKNGRKSLIISFWSLSSIMGATLLKGYANPAPDFAVHRAMIILPPLMLDMFLSYKSSLTFISTRKVVSILLIILCYGIYFFTNKSAQPESLAKPRLVKDLIERVSNENINQNSKISVNIVSSNIRLVSLKDQLIYFFPNITFSYSDSPCPGSSNFIYPQIIYIEHDHPCSSQMNNIYLSVQQPMLFKGIDESGVKLANVFLLK